MKLAPMITTMSPAVPLVGVTLAIVGAGITVKLVALVAVPPGVVTLTGPVVAPVKFAPLIVPTVPPGPLVGVTLVIVGAGIFFFKDAAAAELSALSPHDALPISPVGTVA